MTWSIFWNWKRVPITFIQWMYCMLVLIFEPSAYNNTFAFVQDNDKFLWEILRTVFVTNRLTESKNTKCTVFCNCSVIWKWLLSKLGIWSLKKNQITTKRNPISNLELYNMHKVCTTLPWVHDQKQCKRKVSKTETDKRKRQASSLPHSKLCHSWSINHLDPIKRKNR